MILERLPKIIKIEGGVSPLESTELVLNNYKAVAFIISNTDENEMTIKVKANTEDGVAEYITFLCKLNEADKFENVDDNGKTITTGGVYIVAVTADSLGRNELDRVSLEVTSATDVDAVYALQTQPRYDE